MVQELRETVDEMMKTDVQDIENILNRRPSGHYWIVIHHKPTKKFLDTGEQVLVKVIKDYDSKPMPLLGTIILEVKDGEIIGEQVNLHDMPIDWDALAPHLGGTETPYVQKRDDIATSYRYN